SSVLLSGGQTTDTGVDYANVRSDCSFLILGGHSKPVNILAPPGCLVRLSSAGASYQSTREVFRRGIGLVQVRYDLHLSESRPLHQNLLVVVRQKVLLPESPEAGRSYVMAETLQAKQPFRTDSEALPRNLAPPTPRTFRIDFFEHFGAFRYKKG